MIAKSLNPNRRTQKDVELDHLGATDDLAALLGTGITFSSP